MMGPKIMALAVLFFFADIWICAYESRFITDPALHNALGVTEIVIAMMAVFAFIIGGNIALSEIYDRNRNRK